HAHPHSTSRGPQLSLRLPSGSVSAPHSPIFTTTNAYTPAFFLLAAGHPPLRKTSSHQVKSTARECRQPLPPYESSASCGLSEQRERSPSEADAVLAKDRSPNQRYPDSYPAPVSQSPRGFRKSSRGRLIFDLTQIARWRQYDRRRMASLGGSPLASDNP